MCVGDVDEGREGRREVRRICEGRWEQLSWVWEGKRRKEERGGRGQERR